MKNSESGIFISIGMGYLYHKMFIETLTIELPQLNEELIKAMIDYTQGSQLNNLSDICTSVKNNIRYLIGIESIQAFTKSLRGYNYNTQSINNTQRRDYFIWFEMAL